MSLTLERDDWARLLDQLDDPAVGVVAEAVADDCDVDVLDAYDVVETAVDEGALLEDDAGGALPVVRLPETDETPETADTDTRGAGKRDDDPQGETGETTVADAEAHLSGEVFHPDAVAERDVWVTWILDGAGRKRPVAPWQNGHAYPAKWSSDLDEEDRPETDYETAARWAAFDLADAGLALPDDARCDQLELGIILPHDRADDPEDRAVVFVRTDAAPTGFVDLTVPGVEWLPTDDQQAIVDALRTQRDATAGELAEAGDVSKEHVRKTLRRLRDRGVVDVREGAGDHGAHLYRALGGLGSGECVDLDPQTANDRVWDSYTWSLAIDEPVAVVRPTVGTSTGDPHRGETADAGETGGDPPP